MEKISVLMSTYKEPVSYVSKAVNSILSQTYSNFEFIILVDAPDNAPLIQYLQETASGDPRIQLLINPQNMGLVRSLNRGLEYCTGTYIARMDADDISLPERFAMQTAFLKENDLDLVGCCLELFIDDAQQGTYCVFPQAHTDVCTRLCHTNCVPHPGWLGKREVFTACNGYRQINCCEDYDFILRAASKGFRLGNHPNCLLRYRQNPNSISAKGFAEQNVIAGFLAASFRHQSDVSLQAYLDYKASPKYQKRISRENAYARKFSAYKKQTSAIGKLLSMPAVVTDPLFWKKRRLRANISAEAPVSK